MRDEFAQDRFRIGEVVTDREAPDPSPAIVVKHLDLLANELIVPTTGETLADANPSYPPESPAVEVVFRDALHDSNAITTVDNGLSWNDEYETAETIWLSIQDSTAVTHTYPARRLESTGNTAEKVRTRPEKSGRGRIEQLRVSGFRDADRLSGFRYADRSSGFRDADTLVIGEDFDKVKSPQIGKRRRVCFDQDSCDFVIGDIISVTYGHEALLRDDLPPVLLDVSLRPDFDTPELGFQPTPTL